MKRKIQVEKLLRPIGLKKCRTDRLPDPKLCCKSEELRCLLCWQTGPWKEFPSYQRGVERCRDQGTTPLISSSVVIGVVILTTGETGDLRRRCRLLKDIHVLLAD